MPTLTERRRALPLRRFLLEVSMQIRKILIGGALATVTGLAAYKAFHESVSPRGARQEVTRLRSDIYSARPAGEHAQIPPQLAVAPERYLAVAPQTAARSVSAGETHAPEPQRPLLQPAQLRDRMEGIFYDERVDASWADRALRLAQERIAGTLSDGSDVRSIECRSSMCRIETSHTDEQHYHQFLRKAFLDPETELWNGSVFSTPLDDASQAEGRIVVVAYLTRDGQAMPTVD
jgi:hypothetical protein